MRARELGWDVWGETCTQYFFVDYTFLERPDFEGAKFVYTPPPRAKANQDVLWNAVRTRRALGDLDRPLRLPLGRAEDAWAATTSRRSRTAGRGSRTGCGMIHHFGVSRGPDHAEPDGRAAGDESGEALRALSAQGHDRGRLRRGPRRLRPREARTRSRPPRRSRRRDYNLYEGTEVVGDVETVLLRGNVIVDGGEVVAEPGTGSSSSARASASSCALNRQECPRRRARRPARRGARHGGGGGDR